MNVRSFTLKTTTAQYALVNYEEIIDWYKQPWYKKIFKNSPIKELVTVKL